MIGFLRGLLLEKAPPSLLLDVNGVGYELESPMSTFYNLPEIGREVKLYTQLVVREDAQLLFGFASQHERALFRALIKVNGVGARLALTLLSGLSVDEFHRCVRSQDTASLVRLPGIGKKTAERLIIEMRDRLPESELAVGAAPISAPFQNQGPSPAQEAISALLALGYKTQDAQRMVKSVNAEAKTCEEIIRSALQAAG